MRTDLAFENRQLEFYRGAVDPEEEITRPRIYPLPVRFLLELKIRSVVKLLDSAIESLHALVICCGSGMDAEFLARQGMRVVGLDISPDALLRARERARRYGVSYQLVVGDAENLPFKDGAFELTFVHDGLHHLPDAYRGVREMMRVASRAVAIAEPADAPLTRLAVKLGLSGEWEDAGNYVYRLNRRKLAEVFAEEGAKRWAFRQDLIYYQPWTFRIYKLFERRPLFWLFKLGFHVSNLLLGRWGNSLKAVAWKE